MLPLSVKLRALHEAALTPQDTGRDVTRVSLKSSLGRDTGRRGWSETITAHRLDHCQDYAVESPDGHIGTVSEIRYANDRRTPTALAIRAGRAGSRLLIIPITELACIWPKLHRITLRSSPQLVDTEPIPPEPPPGA